MKQKDDQCCSTLAKNTGCCSGVTSTCCGSQIDLKKPIVIDFMYIDLSVCERCQGTGGTLTEAVKDVKTILEAAGFTIQVNFIHVQSEEQAEELGFISSPTIRINGQDIQMDVKENLCESCGDLCGEEIDCRVWVYDGKEYTIPPKPMIVNAILGHIYSGEAGKSDVPTKGPVPGNLRKFFSARKKQ